MAIYQTKTTTELWTRTGSRTGLKPPVDTLLETSGTFWIRERDLQCFLIVARADGTPYPGDYVNKCVEQSAVKAYVEPPTQTPTPTPDRATYEWLNEAGEVIVTETWIREELS